MCNKFKTDGETNEEEAAEAEVEKQMKLVGSHTHTWHIPFIFHSALVVVTAVFQIFIFYACFFFFVGRWIVPKKHTTRVRRTLTVPSWFDARHINFTPISRTIYVLFFVLRKQRSASTLRSCVIYFYNSNLTINI